MIPLNTLRRPNSRSRVQKRQSKPRRPSPLATSRTTRTALHHHPNLAARNEKGRLMIPPSVTRWQDSCSFRTRLADESPMSDLDDGYDKNNTTRLGRQVPGNPHITPADMLFPETTCDSVSNTQVQKPKSGFLNDATNFTFLTVEEFSDTEMVDPPQARTTACCNNPKKKRRTPFATMPFSQARKRISKKAVASAWTAEAYQRQPDSDEDDVPDDWSVITDISRIQAYGPSDVMKQSVQAVLLRRAVTKARAARKKMRTLERSCRSLFRNAFEPNHGHPTKCVSIGTVC